LYQIPLQGESAANADPKLTEYGSETIIPDLHNNKQVKIINEKI